VARKKEVVRYLLIPSCEVATKNKLAGTITERRLVRGLELWRTGNYDAIIVMGGIYLPLERQTIPLGILMKQWLMENSVPGKVIVCEDHSRDTFENISGALMLVADDPPPEFTVVTHWQHTLRFWATFRLAHRRKIHLIPMWHWIGLNGFVMEWAFLLIHIMDPQGTGWIATKNREMRSQHKS
jgi:hypothetical protein